MKEKILIDCPWCCSGNRFYSLQMEYYKCDDCWAELRISKIKNTGNEINNCIFCGGTYFYYEFFPIVSFFVRMLTCYICEATYSGFPTKKDIKGYREETFNLIKDTPEYKNWHNYWKEFNRNIDYDFDFYFQKQIDFLEKSKGKKLSPKKIAKIKKKFDKIEERFRERKKEGNKLE